MNKTTSQYTPFWASAALMWLLLFLVYPHYQYYIDPDGTSYLTISARYAAGDFERAINGFWSPWSCWLTGLLIRTGLQPIPASVVANTAGATGFLFIANSLFLRFHLSSVARWLFSGSLIVFSCYAIFWQSFDDIWQAFLLLCCFRILLSAGFAGKPWLWMAYGVIGSLAYFAKAYGLPFFLLSTVVCTWFVSGKDKQQWGMMVLVACATMLACAFPWIYALHSKYGIWTTSVTGGLNISWFLKGYHYFDESIDILIKPLYADSTYYWEDPYGVNGQPVHFWDSWYYFGRLVLRFGYNLLMMVVCLLQLSVFVPAIAVVVLLKVIPVKKFALLNIEEQLLYLSLVLFPSGYVLVHFESRYLWYILPLAMIAGALFLQNYPVRSVLIRRYGFIAIALSIVVYPLVQLRAMYDDGREEYRFAMKLNAANIRGVDMVSNLHPRVVSKIAYFSGNRFFFISRQRPPGKDTSMGTDKAANTVRLQHDIKKYGITYYLHAPAAAGKMSSPAFYDIFYENLADSSGHMPFAPIVADAATGITLYILAK